MSQLNVGEVHKILIRGTNWIGDAVMSVPAMKEIRRVFPAAHITLMVRPWVRDVYSAVDFIDAILEYDTLDLHAGFGGKLRIAARMKAGEYDLAILLQNAFEAALLAWLARIPIRIGYARDGRSLLLTHPCRINPATQSAHQAYYYLGILAAAGLIPPIRWDHLGTPPSIAISVRDSDRESARALMLSQGIAHGERVIGINPGAYYGSAKRWLSGRYAAVGDALAKKYHARVVVFGSPEESRIAGEVAAGMKEKPVILAGRTTLGQLMGLLRECAILITNDSGPMHLAAALDVPQLAIFGSTSEIATGPLNRRAVVIKEPVECNPCFLRECPIDFRCMERITVDRVLEAAEQVLELGSDRREIRE